MKKIISIKTVDGNRYEYASDNAPFPHKEMGDWFVVKDDKTSTTKWFYVPNIVSISITPESNDG